MKNIISFSGGKDSTATVILAHEHNIKAKIVMACLWFDKERNIPAIDVEHWNFIINVIIPKFKEWGFEVEFVHQKHSYVELFYHKLTRSKHPERIGMVNGFIIAGRCMMTREKINAIKSIEKKYESCQSIQGIAIDEPKRLETMHKNGGISLLEQYGYTEKMAFDLCEKYGLLSPIYRKGTRDGCWFCPNQKISDWADLRENHNYLWEELVKMSKCEYLVSNKLVRNDTIEDINKKIDKYLEKQKIKDNQTTLFDLLDKM